MAMHRGVMYKTRSEKSLGGKRSRRSRFIAYVDVTEQEAKKSRERTRKRATRRGLDFGWSTLTLGAFAAFSVFFLGPVLWVFLSSFKKPVDVRAIPPVWFFTPVLDQYVSIFWREPIWDKLLNSSVIVGASVFISTLAGSAAAYGISRMERKIRSVTSFLFLFYRMIPLAVLVIPLYRISNLTGLYDTHLGLSLAYTNICLPVVVWLMVIFFSALPVQLEEAAMLDGCSALQYFFRIALPLVAPGLLTTVILCFVLTWSDFILAVVLTGPHTKTIMLEVQTGGGRQAAISVAALLPFFALALLMQRRFVQGLTLGAVNE
jgi:multiple sugar transport system permease protein